MAVDAAPATPELNTITIRPTAEIAPRGRWPPKSSGVDPGWWLLGESASVLALSELNDRIAAADRIDDARHRPGRQFDIGTEFASERTVLGRLPLDGFETGLILHPRVDRHSRITVRSCRYSVPARFVGRRVRVLLRASEVIVFDGRTEVTRHHRSTIMESPGSRSVKNLRVTIVPDLVDTLYSEAFAWAGLA